MGRCDLVVSHSFGAERLQVRNPIPLKIHLASSLFRAKSHIGSQKLSHQYGAEAWRGDASSGVGLVIRPRFKITRSPQSSPSVLQNGALI
ncbi:hypothetical protein AVEN_184390-1 [Araneus ventricosus]|uniref:Uncharacterized protein n=1 Tax=Araneus ventricosus TaxID=182803 RepID=A0A4Y2BHX5_ARAVE|nr:hypothetical protein AVEN_184390-1 [Araneus ventricosus]